MSRKFPLLSDKSLNAGFWFIAQFNCAACCRVYASLCSVSIFHPSPLFSQPGHPYLSSSAFRLCSVSFFFYFYFWYYTTYRLSSRSHILALPSSFPPSLPPALFWSLHHSNGSNLCFCVAFFSCVIAHHCQM